MRRSCNRSEISDDVDFIQESFSMIRKARAVWRGSGRAGNGDLSSDSGVLANTPYSYRTRFENEKGTNLDARLV